MTASLPTIDTTVPMEAVSPSPETRALPSLTRLALAHAANNNAARSPVQQAMMQLFMVVNAFYAEHRELRYDHALVTMMLALRIAVNDTSFDKQRTILAAAADLTATRSAGATRAVQQAIDNAFATLRRSWIAEAELRRQRHPAHVLLKPTGDQR